MYFSTTTVPAAVSLMALMVPSIAAPAPSRIGARSSDCQIVGSTGSATHPVWGTGSTSTTVVGTGLRVVCDGKTAFNSESAPNSTTIKGSDTGLPVDIDWSVEYASPGFKSCSATPAGADAVTGVTAAHQNPFASYFSCTVDLTI